MTESSAPGRHAVPSAARGTARAFPTQPLTRSVQQFDINLFGEHHLCIKIFSRIPCQSGIFTKSLVQKRFLWPVPRSHEVLLVCCAHFRGREVLGPHPEPRDPLHRETGLLQTEHRAGSLCDIVVEENWKQTEMLHTSDICTFHFPGQIRRTSDFRVGTSVQLSL